MKIFSKYKFTFWNVIGTIILIAGGIAIILRYIKGLGATTNLSDQFPWGLWIGFDILCGVGLAAGGFTLAAVVYIFNIEKFRPIIKPTILTAFLGYILVICALMVDLGRPWAIWHAIIMWNPRSVMFEVAWCVMLYSTVLFLEFSPVLLEKFKLHKLIKIVKAMTIPVVILGVILSTLHQSSLGSLYLILPGKMHPLWYSAYLPVFFYVSAIAAGCAMVIFESNLSSRAFNLHLEFDLIKEVARIMLVVLCILFMMRFMELINSHKLHYIFEGTTESSLFILEFAIGMVLPILLLVVKRFRENQTVLFYTASMVIAGFLLNRMNVSITSIAGFTGAFYFPSVAEILVTLFIVVLGVYVFNFIVKNFKVFEQPIELPDEIKYDILKPSEVIKN